MRHAFKSGFCVLLLSICLTVSVSNRALAQGSGTASAPSAPSTSGNSTKPSAPASATTTTTTTTTQTPAAPLNLNVRATENAIDESIPNDPTVDAAIAPYSAKVRELNVPIGKLTSELKKGGIGGGSLGNFVADALRNRAEALLGKPVLLAITNSSGMRKNQIAAGDISASDIYELLPFENALVTLDFTGEQLRRFLDIAVERRDAQAGARIVYRNNRALKKNEIVSVRLREAGGVEKEIDPKAIYTIVTIDYLVKRGGDYSILQEAKNIKPLSLTMRDAVLEYVKAETAAGRPLKAALDGRFSYDRSTPGQQTEEDQP